MLPAPITALFITSASLLVGWIISLFFKNELKLPAKWISLGIGSLATFILLYATLTLCSLIFIVFFVIFGIPSIFILHGLKDHHSKNGPICFFIGIVLAIVFITLFFFTRQ